MGGTCPQVENPEVCKNGETDKHRQAEKSTAMR